MPSTSAGPGAYVYSWTLDDVAVYVDNQAIPASDILQIVPAPALFGVTFIQCSLGSLPNGFHGQKDVTVVLRAGSAFNPVGRDLYFTMKDGLYVPPSAANWRTYGRVVAPRTVPAAPLPNEAFQVRVLGSGLAGPYPRDPSSDWPWTDVELRWGASVLSLASVPEANYTVFSFFEALFTVFDVTAYGVPVSSPGNVNPVDVALVTYDGCTGLPVQEDVIKDGIIFWESLPRILATNVSPRTEASGAGGISGPGTFTVGAGTLEPGAYGGHYLLDASFNAFMILTNTDSELTLYGGSPVNGAWRIERGAYPIDSGLGGTWNAVSERFTAAPDPGWGALAGQYLIDVNNNSFDHRQHVECPDAASHVGAARKRRMADRGAGAPGSRQRRRRAECRRRRFLMANMPHMRIGPVEARVMTYNSGYISAHAAGPFDLPGTYDVSSVWPVTATGTPSPPPGSARPQERMVYLRDGRAAWRSSRSSLQPDLCRYVPVTEPMQDPEQFITITGYNSTTGRSPFTFTDEQRGPTPISVAATFQRIAEHDRDRGSRFHGAARPAAASRAGFDAGSARYRRRAARRFARSTSAAAITRCRSRSPTTSMIPATCRWACCWATAR